MARPDTFVDNVTSIEAEAEHAQLVRDPREQDFGKYKLCYQLAAGGMATVYLARAIGPSGIERLVAIKRIHKHLATNPSLVEMFLDEARIASRINHPNVCMVHDFGEHEGGYYLAMEYLLGEPLNRVAATVAKREDLIESPAWRALAARIVAHACEGLYAAHRVTDVQGRPLEVVHRDVSLHNLFVTYAGAVKVLDFGIAKAATQIHQTHAGSLKGTYAYMAPEQFQTGNVDHRADIWSLGVCLWELCVGARLFRRETQMLTMRAVCSEPVIGPQVVRPSVPDELAAITMKALSRDPERRFQTARAMSQALGEYLAGCGQRTGMPELEEWMGKLFGVERDTKLERVEAVIAEGGDIHERPTELWTGQRGPEPETTRSTVRLTSRSPRLGLGLLAGVLPVAVAAAVLATVLVMKAGETRPRFEVSPPVTAPPGPVEPEAEPPPASSALERVERAVPPAREETAAEPNGEEVSETRSRRDPARPRPRQPAVMGVGHVNISTPGGWAEIYEGGRLVGRTPRQLQLAAGRHVIELRPFGRGPGVRRTVEVRADGVQRLSVPVSGP